MNREDEEYLFECLEQIKEETHENNSMLRHLVKVANTYIANHRNENEEDFLRNIIANIVSSGFDISKLIRR